MPDESVRQLSPLALREQVHEIGFDPISIRLLGPAESKGKPRHVSIDRDSRDAKGIAEDDVGGLAAHPGQSHKISEPGRHLPSEVITQRLCETLQTGSLGSEKAGGLDHLLEFAAVCRGIGGGRGVLREQRRRDLIYPAIGALG